MSKTSDSPEYLCKKCAVKIGRGKRQEHIRLKHRKELRVLRFPDGTEGPVRRSSSDETWHCPRCHVSCGPDPEVLIAHAQSKTCRGKRRDCAPGRRPLPSRRGRGMSSDVEDESMEEGSIAEVERALMVSDREDMDIDINDDTQGSIPDSLHVTPPTNPINSTSVLPADASTSADMMAMDVEPATISPVPRRLPRIPAFIPKTAPPRPAPVPRPKARVPSFACPKPGCTKVYLQKNGLKYHLDKGTCEFPPAMQVSSSFTMNLNALPSPPDSSGTPHHPSPSPALTYISAPPAPADPPSAPPPEIPEPLMRFFLTLGQMPSAPVIAWFLDPGRGLTTDDYLDYLAIQTAEVAWPNMITEIREVSDFSEWMSIKVGLQRRKESLELGAVGNPIVVDD